MMAPGLYWWDTDFHVLIPPLLDGTILDLNIDIGI